MWTTNYIISQICMVVTMGIFSISMFTKSKKIILVNSAINSFLYSIHYFLLGGYTAVFLNLISVLRGVFFYFDDRDGLNQNYLSLTFILLSLTAVSLTTYSSIVDLLPILSISLYTISIWQKNIKFYRFSALLGNILFIVYNFILGSIMGVLSEAILVVIEIVGIKKLYKKEI